MCKGTRYPKNLRLKKLEDTKVAEGIMEVAAHRVILMELLSDLVSAFNRKVSSELCRQLNTDTLKKHITIIKLMVCEIVDIFA